MARKESFIENVVNLAHVQGYHHCDHMGNYAFQGFASNKYFTSDRYEKLDEHFNRTGENAGKPLKGYGLEIETACNSVISDDVYAEILMKIVFQYFPDDLFKLQRDASLSGRSTAECITQVMTRQFIRNNYRNFKTMYDVYFPAIGASCNASCGMHVNISNANFGDKPATQELAIRKFYYIVNKHYDLCVRLFARNPDRTGYCSRMNPNVARTMDLSHQYSDHGVSFNLGHYREGRIELRLVGGQRSYGCFRNTMESVFFLVDRVKKLSWADCDNLATIFSGCNQYVYDRLNTKCRDYISTDALNTIHENMKTEVLL